MAGKSGIDIKTTVYGEFKGADFSSDPSLVSKSRSPLCTNMIADAGGMPEKRPGWRTLHTLTGSVNGLFYLAVGGVVHFIAHVGTRLYRWDEAGLTDSAPTELLTGLTNEKSMAVTLLGKLWIVTGGEYLCYDGTAAGLVSERDDVFIPTVTLGRAPSGGGTRYYDVNLLTPYRRDSFLADGTAAVYQLSATALDASGDITVEIDGEAVTTGWTADRTAGTVTFDTAPAAPDAGAADNVRITYPKTVAGYAGRVNSCRIISSYGVGGSDRVVLSGNPDFGNLDWISGYSDPTYIPDLNYATVGGSGTEIMGYCRLGSYQAVVKASNGQDSTVFLRSSALDSDGEAVFALQQSIAGVGAVARRSFAELLDEPLFLSGTGIYAITSSGVTSEKIAQGRSYYLNAALTAERNLEEACAVSWRGMYLLAVNSHVYILDGRQEKTYRSETLGDYVYEGYYWEHVPAVCLMNHVAGATEDLYFGTNDGRICRFNTDRSGMNRFSDDGAAISAVWATKADNDGDSTLLKTMIKRGNSVTLKPYTRSSAKVCFRTEADCVGWPATYVDWQAAYDTMDIFDWTDIDFSRLAFSANDAPQEIMFNCKVKKYKRLQILIRNDGIDEGFGIFNITKHYVYGNYAKR